MNNIFNKLDNKIADLNLLKSVETEKSAEFFRLAEKAVNICKTVLVEYETEFKKRGFSVFSCFNTHYFEFRVSDFKNKQFPIFEISMSNCLNSIAVYLVIDNQTKQTGQPPIDINFNAEIFKSWLDDKINVYFNL